MWTLDLIPHPCVDEMVVPNVSEREAQDLLMPLDPKLARYSIYY